MKKKDEDIKVEKGVLAIRRSCLTGKIVWLARCKSKHAAHQAYYAAKKRELQHYRNWEETATQRRANILGLLNECLADIPFTQQLSRQQAVAARKLQQLSEEDIACHLEFYQHIREEDKRRRRAHEIRLQLKNQLSE